MAKFIRPLKRANQYHKEEPAAFSLPLRLDRIKRMKELGIDTIMTKNPPEYFEIKIGLSDGKVASISFSRAEAEAIGDCIKTFLEIQKVEDDHE